MDYLFEKHYTLDEARALLPEVRRWLGMIDDLRRRLLLLETRIASLQVSGQDSGGNTVNESLKTLAELQVYYYEFQRREIQIKDVERGLIDFPSLKGGKEIFLCWEKDEEDIEFWHDLESGYSGREKFGPSETD